MVKGAKGAKGTARKQQWVIGWDDKSCEKSENILIELRWGKDEIGETCHSDERRSHKVKCEK